MPITAISPDDSIRYKAHVTANYSRDYIKNLLGYAKRLLVHAQVISAVSKPFPVLLLKPPPKGATKKKESRWSDSARTPILLLS